MPNINKKVLISVGVILIVVLGILSMNKSSKTPEQNNPAQNSSAVETTNTNNTTSDKTSAVTTTKPKVVVASTSGKCNVTITYPKPGSSVSFPLTVKGYIDNTKTSSCTWYQKQLRAGDVQISYNLRNEGWTPSGIPVPIVTDGSTMTTSTSAFTVSLNLLTTPLGITTGTPIKLTFTELDTAGAPNPNRNHFDLNVYAK